MKYIFLFSICSFVLIESKCQAIVLRFSPMFQDQMIQADSLFITKTKDSLHFETIKFYISNIQFLNRNKVIYTDKIKAYLIDNENEKSKNITIKNTKKLDFDAIQFNIGIDSVTNVGGALGGDLDPTKGMYWAWQSGYINCKLEGKATSSSDRLHQFQFHLGGYNGEQNALQKIVLPSTNQNNITIGIDICNFLQSIDMNTTHHIMSPSTDAVKLSKQFAYSFSIIK